MARTVTEDMDGISVTAVYNSRTKDYLVYTSLTGLPGAHYHPESVVWIMKRPERPRSSEWGVAWRTTGVTWHPTLSSALHAVGKRVLKEHE